MMGLPRTSFLSLDSVQARGGLTTRWAANFHPDPQPPGKRWRCTRSRPRTMRVQPPTATPAGSVGLRACTATEEQEGAGSRAHSLPAAEALCSGQGSPRCPGSSGAKGASE